MSETATFTPDEGNILCPACDGTGLYPDGRKCPVCDGTRQVKGTAIEESGEDGSLENLRSAEGIIKQALEKLKKSNDELEKTKKERDLIKAREAESIEKAKTWDRVSQTNKWLTISEAAKNLAFKNVGPIILESILRAEGVFMNTEPALEHPL